MLRPLIGALIGALVVPSLVGCRTSYVVVFEPADVINTSSDSDMSRKMLDVDIVCLDKEAATTHSAMVNQSLRADEWFKLRDSDDGSIADIKKEMIFALRKGRSEQRDTLAGEPLLSRRDYADQRSAVEVPIKHPTGYEDGAHIVIYGRFIGPGGPRNTMPVVIDPPSNAGRLRIRVDRDSMSYIGPEK